MAELLRTEGLTKRFQGLLANDAIDFRLASRELRCVIGPNGAGKTTFISMISGHLRPTAGTIWYRGEKITQLPVPARARRGIGRKFQTPSVFDNQSVLENAELAVLAAARRPADARARIAEVLALVRLEDQADTLARNLSHGQRQWLEIALLLANDAKLLLLDEPTAGMTAEETAATGQLVRQLIAEQDVAAIIIEHDINFIRALRAPITVLHLGRVLVEGSFDEIAGTPRCARSISAASNDPRGRGRRRRLRTDHGPARHRHGRGAGRDPGGPRPQRHGQVDPDPLPPA